MSDKDQIAAEVSCTILDHDWDVWTFLVVCRRCGAKKPNPLLITDGKDKDNDMLWVGWRTEHLEWREDE